MDEPEAPDAVELEHGSLDVPDESRRVEMDDGRYGWRPDESTPVPNRADNAWQDLLALRDEARALGIEVSDDWPINRLQREISRHRPS